MHEKGSLMQSAVASLHRALSRDKVAPAQPLPPPQQQNAAQNDLPSGTLPPLPGATVASNASLGLSRSDLRGKPVATAGAGVSASDATLAASSATASHRNSSSSSPDQAKEQQAAATATAAAAAVSGYLTTGTGGGSTSLFYSRSFRRMSKERPHSRKASDPDPPAYVGGAGLQPAGPHARSLFLNPQQAADATASALAAMPLEDVESRDQVSELSLSSHHHLHQQQPLSRATSGGALHHGAGLQQQQQQSHAAARPHTAAPASSSSAATASTGTPLASVSPFAKHAKSLPKISAVFAAAGTRLPSAKPTIAAATTASAAAATHAPTTTKGPRAASEQPQALHSHNHLLAPPQPTALAGSSGTAVSTSALAVPGAAGGAGAPPPGAPLASAGGGLGHAHGGRGGLSAYEIAGGSAATAAAGQLPQRERPYQLDDFHIVRRAGKGGFASVFLVRLRASSGRYFALKAIKKADVLRLRQERQVMNEKNILRATRHPFVVELYSTFQDAFYLYMVMEYIDGGDLFSYLRKVQ
ncbi:hypothetical protein HK405_012502, partial [Cladochytrium tenue]